MDFQTLVVGYLATNCYVLAGKAGDAVIIDPGANADRILRLIDEMQARPQCIILTHTHSDHIGALESVRRVWDVPVLLSADEADFLRLPAARRVKYERGNMINPTFNTLSDGDAIDVGGFEIITILTPGHTPGSISLRIGDMLFSGDTLFKDGIGRTDFEGGSQKMIMASIKTRLLTLPAPTEVYPGHGEPTTIGAERKYFP